MQQIPDLNFPAFRLGSPPPSATEFASAAGSSDVADWSAVFGGTVRLAGDEWCPSQGVHHLLDVGGSWLMIVPVGPVPGPFLPTSSGFTGPISAGRVALAVWLLLASLSTSEMPDVLLVADQSGAELPSVSGGALTPLPGRVSTTLRLPWPRSYRFAAGYFTPPESHSDGNAEFASAAGLVEGGKQPGWLARLQIPCALAALGEPPGTEAAELTWQDLGTAAHRLATLSQNLDGALWPRGESAAVPGWELDELTPESEREERGAEGSKARHKLPGWMADAPPAGGSAGLIGEAKDWDPS